LRNSSLKLCGKVLDSAGCRLAKDRLLEVAAAKSQGRNSTTLFTSAAT
jgi:hypothetical protein